MGVLANVKNINFSKKKLFSETRCKEKLQIRKKLKNLQRRYNNNRSKCKRQKQSHNKFLYIQEAKTVCTKYFRKIYLQHNIYLKREEIIFWKYITIANWAKSKLGKTCIDKPMLTIRSQMKNIDIETCELNEEQRRTS